MSVKPRDVAQQLEAVVLRQLLSQTKVFRGEGAGAHVYGGMFVEALADAISKGGGLGLAGTLDRVLGMSDAHGQTPAARATGHDAAAGSLEALVLATSRRVSSGFGPRVDPLTGQARFHRGLDIAAPAGSPIHAARDGVVRFAGPDGEYGLAVEIDHGDGLVTRYAHASKLHARAGDRVRQGDWIADVGSTGRSTGPHLHLEAVEAGRRVDPLVALNPATEPAE